MTPRPVAAEAVAKVAEDFRRRGYEVRVAPRGPDLPDFLAEYQPDLIARSPDDSVVVEVKVGTRTSVAERFREIAERVNRQPGWRFSLMFVNPEQPDQVSEAPLASLTQLQDRVRSADALVGSGQSEAAFMLFWSALEGLLRTMGQRAQLPVENLPPSALVRELYSAGEMSRQQFELALRLLPMRDRVVHGFGSRGEDLEVEALRALVHALLTEVAPAPS